MNKKNYYWDEISEKIGILLQRFLFKDMKILEVGFSSGHFLEYLNELGYKFLHGVEIREDQYQKTLDSFNRKSLNISLSCGDVLKTNEKYDAIFSTGLIQCLNESNLEKFISHISSLADIAFFTVPELLEIRNTGSKEKVGVAGCTEYPTSNLSFILSNYYDLVLTGRLDSCSGTEDDFIYYFCKKRKI